MCAARTTVIHEEIEPGVINADMIIKSVLDSCPKGEVGRLIAEDGIILEDVKELRLEFLNILRIDHLWMLDSLAILHISNNMIEKIENLDRLVNLKELDLSFNNIEVIENLDNLVKLEVLTLFGNQITKLDNLKNLKLLMIFSIGNNLLSQFQDVVYLRQFKNLRALNMSGNPVATRESFREYVHAFLPQLVYYEYRMITPTEREMANIRFKDELKEMLAVEDVAKEDAFDAEEFKRHSEAFVENLNTDRFFQSLFRDDAEGIAFLKLNDDSEELFIDFKDKFMAQCMEVFNFALTQYDVRKAEVDQYEICKNEAKSLIMEKSRDMMNEFIEKKSEIFLEMRNIASLIQAEADAEDEIEDHFDEYSQKIRELATEFQEQSHQLWQELMKMEMTLFEQIEEATSNFEVCLRELLNQFLEGSQVFFVRMRDEENNYFEQMSDITSKFYNDLNVMEDAMLDLDDDMRALFSDRDGLTAAVTGSHEVHLQVIDERQDTLSRKANTTINDFFDKLRKDEVKRNRWKIVEISHFMDLQQEEYDEILSMCGVHVEEPDWDVGEDDERGADRAARHDSDESEEGEEGEEEEGEEGKPGVKGTWEEEKEKRKAKRRKAQQKQGSEMGEEESSEEEEEGLDISDEEEKEKEKEETDEDVIKEKGGDEDVNEENGGDEDVKEEKEGDEEVQKENIEVKEEDEDKKDEENEGKEDQEGE